MLIRVLRSSIGSALMLTMAALLLTPAIAAADDLIVIPVSGFARGDEGDVISIATVPVPTDLVGATCQITGSTVNQISVHEGNDLLIISGGQTFTVPNFEDAGFIVHEAGETASLGSTVELQIRFGPDGVSSGGFRVSVDCQPDIAPTTAPPLTTTSATAAPTTAPPTTELPPAGPTAPSTTEAPTTTTPPSTDVAAEPPASPAPTTALPPTTAPPTTAPTTELPPAGPSASDDGQLPVTGSSSSLLVGLGSLLVGIGLLIQRVSGRASRAD